MGYFFELLYSRYFPRTGQYLDKASQLGMTNEDRYLFIYPPEFIQQCDGLLRKAEQKAKTPRAKNWLRMTRDHFDYVRHVGDMYALYRAYRTNPTRENVLQLKERVGEFDAWRTRVILYEKSYTDRWFPGHRMFSNFLTSGGRGPILVKNIEDRQKRVREKGVRGLAIGFHRTAIREPITLDFDVLLERKGTAPRAAISARRISRSLRIDGALDEEEWKLAAPQLLKALSGVSSDAKTTVRLLYDDRHLYVGYECGEPRIAALKAEPTGRDGGVWYLDCVDNFLSPSDATRRYQFMVAPARDAFYDARLGFLGEKRDQEWNPRWHYGFQVDKQSKRWAMEIAIPFAELGEKTPQPGTKWRGNFCRVRRAGATRPGGGGPPELFMWSPSGKVSFADPSALGHIHFRE